MMKLVVTTLKWFALLIAIVLVAGALFITFFDWNLARGWINNEVSAATGRHFAIRGDLSLRWLPPDRRAPGLSRWLPRPRLIANDIVLSNPDWARDLNMIELGQLQFSLEWMPLLEKRVVMPDVTLSAPRISLEQRDDGQNNWTFKQSSGAPTPWQFDIGRLVLEDGLLRVRDTSRKLDLNVAVTTLDGQSPYGIGFKIDGHFNDVAVHGRGRGGDVLSLEDSGTPYPLDAEVHIGRTTIAVQGTFTNPTRFAALDMRLRLSGPTMADLYPITGVVLPDTPAYSTEGRLIHLDGEWRYERFSGKVGNSDLGGTLTFRPGSPRPMLQGAVVSNLLRFADLGPIIGAPGSNQQRSSSDLGPKPPAQPTGKVLPVAPFKTDRWRAIDADVQFTGRKIVHGKDLPIDNLTARVRLNDGVLTLSPLRFGVAGGQLSSDVVLDGRAAPMQARLGLTLRHLKLKQLLPEVDLMKTSLGEINGDAALSATGNSVAALLGSSNGEIKTLVDRGKISKLLLETLGLNLADMVVYKIFGDKQVDIRCAATDFSVTDGLMDARTFLVDTDDSNIGVTGQINLKQEKLNLIVKPEPKHFGVLSLRSPLYVRGTFKHPDVGIDTGVLLARAGGALALGLTAPIATALIPLLDTGPGKDSPCHTLFRALDRPSQAPAPGRRASPPPPRPPAAAAPARPTASPLEGIIPGSREKP